MKDPDVKNLLRQTDATWRPHNRWGDGEGLVACLAVGLDHRSLPHPRLGDRRMMVTFGPNPFLDYEPCLSDLPPLLPGAYAFGIHVAGVKGDRVAIYDETSGSKPSRRRDRMTPPRCPT
ncbi:MAG: hypothetical protein K2P78_07545 [Gemmataceae bacterium]|nr:hypothetical protein [Gemmataceae bacterium]